MEILNAKQWRPLDAAAANGWEKIVLVLMESGTNIEPRGKIKVKLFVLIIAYYIK